MLTITVPGTELFDEKNQEFITHDEFELELEHSLVAISKWESIYEKPFLGKDEKTSAEVIAYVQCMTVTPNVPLDVYFRLNQENFDQISTYIDAKMTATWFNETPSTRRPSSEIITSELIYYWMVALNVPFECDTWHLNRLLTLIKIINIKNAPKKKRSRGEVAAEQRALNEKRRAEWEARKRKEG